MASLKLEHIYKVYPNGTKAVNDVSLDIKNGEFIVFVGPSGCGKSTTLRMIAGLEEITAGELYIDSTIVNDVEPKDRDIAMVFQNYALYPHMTVYENMAFGLKLRHVPDDIIQEKVLWAADILGLKDYLDRKPRAMSGGQRQRVALGRAILRDPKVMLLDEPLSNLDAKLRTQMRAEIAKLHQRLKTTFIYVTHDQTEAMTLGNRVVVMKSGCIQQVDTPKNLYDYPSNIFVAGFIGTPQMNFLDCTLLKKDDEVVIHLKKADVDFTVPYNSLIKVNPIYLDGNHDIVMGIRCENVHLVKDEDKMLSMTISHFEELGSESLAYGSIDDINGNPIDELSVISKVFDRLNYQSGDHVAIAFDMDHTYFFDKKTEETIIPRIPTYNSFDCKVTKDSIKVLGGTIPLPKALINKIEDNDKVLELQIPSDAITISEAGVIKAEVVRNEVINDVNLIHLKSDNRIYFMKSDKKYEEGSIVNIDIDFTKIKVLDGEKVVLEPISSLDSMKAYFYNYQTVISKDNNPEFVKFREDKVKAALDYMDAKIALYKQDHEKEIADIKQISIADAETKFAELCKNNDALVEEKKKETKEKIDALTKKFKEDKKQAKIANDKLFAEKKEQENREYKEFKASNNDKEALKRRSDEYHIFKDNFATDRENTLNLAINSLTMDYEAQISSLKASLKREIEVLNKEKKDAKEKLKEERNPQAYLEKKYKKGLKALEQQREQARKRAELVFFFRFAQKKYIMASDIIANKLVQGLGTRVFTKEFRIDFPHDAYTIRLDNQGFKVRVVDNYDYGNTYFVKVAYEDNGEKYLYIRNQEPLEVNKEISIDFDITRCQVTETGMNIRLY